tara:strand:- start:247 stop:1557 length:1311 start_codon:yes stop_codon:yes gene_type:complete
MSNILTNNINPRSGNTININGTISGINVSGVSTIGNVVVGGATTELVVTGDARVTGILTVGTASVTLNGNDGTISGINTINGVSYPSTGPLSNRNIIINGAMQVAQRGTSVTSINSIATTYATIDRMYHAFNSYGAWTSTQESDGPDGFANSWKVDCTTANSSLSAGDYAIVLTRIEAQDLQHLKYGASSAEDTVISFWVKSNKTGAASWEIKQYDNSAKQFCTSYTINAANTWEYKTITIPGDTAGVMNDDNGLGVQISWWLGGGSDFTGGTHASTWEANNNVNRNVYDLACGMTIGDYFQLTGIQWELGTQATPFEHRSFGDELKRCERYYEKSFTYSSAPGTATANGALSHRKTSITTGYTGFNPRFGTRKRATPTIGLYNTNNSTVGQIRSDAANVDASDLNTNEMGFIVNTDTTQGANVIQSMHYTADAEL